MVVLEISSKHGSLTAPRPLRTSAGNAARRGNISEVLTLWITVCMRRLGYKEDRDRGSRGWSSLELSAGSPGDAYVVLSF